MSAIRKAVATPSVTTATTSIIAAGAFAVLAALAGLSYDLGPIADVIPPTWKPIVLKVSGTAAAVLWFYGQIQTHLIRKDAAKQLKRKH